MKKGAAQEVMKWLESLTPLERMNFRTLITLPNAEKVIKDMDMEDCKYRRMAELGIVFSIFLENE